MERNVNYYKQNSALTQTAKSFIMNYYLHLHSLTFRFLNILNILAGKCSTEKRQRPYLLSSIHITVTNSEAIILEILSTLNKIYDRGAQTFSFAGRLHKFVTLHGPQHDIT